MGFLIRNNKKRLLSQVQLYVIKENGPIIECFSGLSVLVKSSIRQEGDVMAARPPSGTDNG